MQDVSTFRRRIFLIRLKRGTLPMGAFYEKRSVGNNLWLHMGEQYGVRIWLPSRQSYLRRSIDRKVLQRHHRSGRCPLFLCWLCSWPMDILRIPHLQRYLHGLKILATVGPSCTQALQRCLCACNLARGGAQRSHLPTVGPSRPQLAWSADGVGVAGVLSGLDNLIGFYGWTVMR